MLQVGAQLGHFARAAGALLAQLIQRGASALQLRLHAPPVAGAEPAPGRPASAPAPALRRARLSAPARAGPAPRSLERAARARPSAARPLLVDGLHTALQVGMEPVNALEGSLRAAPPLFQAGQLRGHLRRLLLQALALLPQQGQLRLQLIESRLGRRGARPPGAASPRASGRCWLFLALARVLVARGLRRPLLQAAARRAASRPPSASAPRPGWRCRARPAAAPRCAPPVARPVPRWPASAPRLPSPPAPDSASSLPRRLSASRNSRFSASGPSLAGLPPVTVALWKHSPSGVRKKACVCRAARRSASPGSSTR